MTKSENNSEPDQYSSDNMGFDLKTVFIVSCVILSASAYFENCDFVVNLLGNEGTAIVNPGAFLLFLRYFGYIGYFRPGTSCRYVVKVPDPYVVDLQCDIDIVITGSNGKCITEQFRVLENDAGDILNKGQFYCGLGHVNVTSKTNSMVFGYTSKSYGGKYNCTVMAVWKL